LQNEEVLAYLKTIDDHVLWNVLKMQPSMFDRHTPSISYHSLDFVDLDACDAIHTFSIGPSSSSTLLEKFMSKSTCCSNSLKTIMGHMKVHVEGPKNL
jgi:hypothetical protein